jgi:hypothetical protein
MHSAIAVASFENPHYLRDPPCFLTDKEQEDAVCLDPSPIGVRVHVEELLFGKLKRSDFTAVTTSHGGTETLRRVLDKPLLMVIENGRNQFLYSEISIQRFVSPYQWRLGVADYR